MTTKRRSHLITALRRAHLLTVRNLCAIKRELRSPEADRNPGLPDGNRDSIAEMLDLQNRKRLIEGALHRVGNGGYGACTRCGEAIDQQHLLLVPWAADCIPCQSNADSGAVSQNHAHRESAGEGKLRTIRLAP